MAECPAAARFDVRRLVVWLAVIVASAVSWWWAMQVTRDNERIYITPPGFFGHWQFVWPAALTWSIPVAIALVVVAPHVRHWSWRWSAPAWAAGSSLLWAATLALAKGWQGFVHRGASKLDYRAVLGDIGSTGEFLRTFVDRLDHYPLHVTGHPPGYPLILSWLAHLGLASPGWEAALMVLSGAVAATALTLTVRELVDDDASRRVAVFVGVLPSAVWVVVGADGFFAALASGALLAASLATTSGASPTRQVLAGASCGLLAAVLLYCTYGAPTLLVPTAIVLLTRRRLLVITGAVVGFLVIVVAVTAAGFWWFDGLSATREFYIAGVAARRPYRFFLLANLVVTAWVMGPAVIDGFARLADRRVWWLVGSAIAGIVIADASGLSKAEVERIWIPMIMIASVGVLGLDDSDRSTRFWLGAQLATGIAFQAVLQGLW